MESVCTPLVTRRPMLTMNRMPFSLGTMRSDEKPTASLRAMAWCMCEWAGRARIRAPCAPA